MRLTGGQSPPVEFSRRFEFGVGLKRNPIVATATARAVIFAFFGWIPLLFSGLGNGQLLTSTKASQSFLFENLSQEKTNTYIAEGIQGEILTKLAAMRELKVISRSSSVSRPEQARQSLRAVAQRARRCNYP